MKFCPDILAPLSPGQLIFTHAFCSHERLWALCSFSPGGGGDNRLFYDPYSHQQTAKNVGKIRGDRGAGAAGKHNEETLVWRME